MNLTKRIILSTVAMVSFIILAYLACSFVKFTLNPIQWGEFMRMGFALFSMGIGGCVFGITMGLTEKQ